MCWMVCILYERVRTRTWKDGMRCFPDGMRCFPAPGPGSMAWCARCLFPCSRIWNDGMLCEVFPCSGTWIDGMLCEVFPCSGTCNDGVVCEVFPCSGTWNGEVFPWCALDNIKQLTLNLPQNLIGNSIGYHQLLYLHHLCNIWLEVRQLQITWLYCQERGTQTTIHGTHKGSQQHSYRIRKGWSHSADKKGYTRG
ncbi:hypothetical protein AALO_G00028130, partial [Alosa alosa]